jgi:tetratricopeptide (TPR) repeat protein
MNGGGDVLDAGLSEDPALGDLVEAVTERLQAGLPADVDALAGGHAGHAAALRELLPALQALAGAAPDGPAPARPGLSTLGDFRLLREVGRGGMGVVYEAEQVSLGRRVALKVLPFAAALHPRQLERFRTEAQAAARLHHTHIVPVFAVGSDQGVHYYAMQFIDGQNLAAAVAGLRGGAGAPAPPDASTAEAGAGRTAGSGATSLLGDAGGRRGPAYYRTVARIGVQAAEALEHAHQMGVVHRDVKPANLMLDARGHLWVTDFGLVRCAGDAGLTGTGELPGTLRYMSPEQASGRRGAVDHRTDVYSLGATLYELLTLEPLCPGEGRGEVLQRVTAGEPRPPRRVDRALPAELETIVLKAAARDPDDRYATAQELADDLRRFLEDKPIRARKPAAAVRLRRWAYRRRGVLAAAALSGVAALAAGLVTAARDRDRAEAQRREARLAVDTMYTEVAEHWLARQPHLEPMQRDFLRKALDIYETFASESGGDPAARLEAARAARCVGDIRHRLGNPGGADAAYGGALARLRPPAETGDAGAREELAVCLAHRGNLLRDVGKAAQAEAACREARDLFAALPATALVREGVAGTENNLGLALHAQDRFAEAEAALRSAVAAWQRLAADEPGQPVFRYDLAAGYNNLACLLRDTGRPDDACTTHELAREIFAKLAADSPETPVYRQALATTDHNLGRASAALGRPREADAAFRAALAPRARLAAEFPQVVVYSQELAATHYQRALLLTAAGRYPEAERAHREAFALRARLASPAPAAPAHRRELAASHHGFGAVLAATGRLPAAEQAYREALALRGALAAEFPARPAFRQELAASRRGLGGVLAAAGRPGPSEEEYRQAAAALEGVTGPVADEERAALAHELGQLLDRTGRREEAEAAYRRCVEAAGAPAALRAAALADLGGLLAAGGRAAEGEKCLRRALALWRKLAAAEPPVAAYAAELAWLLATCPAPALRDPSDAMRWARRATQAAPDDGAAWGRLGAACYRAGDYPAARAALAKAAGLRAGGDCVDCLFLAMAHARLGNAGEARDWYRKASSRLGQAPDRELQGLRAEAAEVVGPAAGP